MEHEIDNLQMVDTGEGIFIEWRTRTDFEYGAQIGDYVKVCLENKIYDRGRIIGISEAGFDMDTGTGLIFKKVSVNYDDVIYIEKLGGFVL